MPGGEFLRTEMLDQLRTADQMLLRQSPRSAGLDVASTRQMRDRVLEGLDSGRFSAEYVREFLANRDASGWPRRADGRAWQVDHVFELWQGGADDLSNYLPIDPDLHAFKTELLRRFRLEWRDGKLIADEQVDVNAEL